MPVTPASDFNDLANVASLDEVRKQLKHSEPTVAAPEWPDPILPGTLR